MKRVSMFVTLLMIVAIVAGACAAPTATPTAAPTQPAAAAPTKAPAQPTQAPAVSEPTKAPEPTTAPEPSMEMMGGLPMVDAGAVTGDIVSAGSSTVFPLSEAMAARFQDEGYKGNITIDSIGSGAGLERFCKTGETDIANASRAIKSSEVDNVQGHRPHARRVPHRHRRPGRRRQSRQRVPGRRRDPGRTRQDLLGRRQDLGRRQSGLARRADPALQPRHRLRHLRLLRRSRHGQPAYNKDAKLGEEALLKADESATLRRRQRPRPGRRRRQERHRVLRLCLLPGKCRQTEGSQDQRRRALRLVRGCQHLSAGPPALHLLATPRSWPRNPRSPTSSTST